LPEAAGTILIVDDEKINRALFAAQLAHASYRTVAADNGETGLRLAREEQPDVILLDVMMPGLSGYDVARRLKQDEATRNIPIIMVTALDDQESRLTALRSGAEEFLTKPVMEAELLTRVHNLLKLKKYQDSLAAERLHLEDAVKAGKLQLDQAQEKLLQSEKMASIGLLAAGVAHEINNPVGYVKSNFSVLQRYAIDLLALLGRYEAVDSFLPPDAPAVRELMEAKRLADLDFLREDILELLAQSLDGIGRIEKIVRDLKNFARTDARPAFVMGDLNACIESALSIATNEIKYKADVVKELGDLPDIECSPSQLAQVFLNLLVNAAQAIRQDGPRGVITIRSGVDGGDRVRVEIADTGCGMTEAQMKRIFDPFYTTKPVGVGTGLGLSISYSILEAHGGKIEVASTIGEGSTFRLSLPVRQKRNGEATNGKSVG
jgi:two-component system, NtrC family, sensor kinase